MVEGEKKPVKKVVDAAKAEKGQVKLRQKECDVEIEEQNRNFLLGVEVINDVDNGSFFFFSQLITPRWTCRSSQTKLIEGYFGKMLRFKAFKNLKFMLFPKRVYGNYNQIFPKRCSIEKQNAHLLGENSITTEEFSFSLYTNEAGTRTLFISQIGDLWHL